MTIGTASAPGRGSFAALDDETVYGETFELLTFKDALEAAISRSQPNSVCWNNARDGTAMTTGNLE
jgi:hypothetical protein